MKNLKLIMCLLISFLLAGETIGQQFQVSQGTSATEMANALAGDGVVISNAETSGNVMQKGLFFNGGSLLGIENGVILTTGQASYATNTNNIASGLSRPIPNDLEHTLITEDPDLEQLQDALDGVSIFEFDVVISKSLLEFEFVFASEEYPNWVGSQFNDVFGFFISGPGIEGEFSNEAKNIAIVPGTDEFISVNTINHLDNSQFFNWGGGQNGGTNLTYGGYTDVLKVSCPVICGETYHIKIAISNVNDDNLDSAIFLKEGSLFSEFTIDYLFTDAQPICEGQLFNMTVEGGENGWTYEWSDGQVTSVPSISTIASLDVNAYNVTVTDENGCMLSGQVTVSVHASDNEPPFTSGIDGIPYVPSSGEFTASVHAGETLCFQIPTYDDSGERVTIFADPSSLPQGASFIGDDAFQEIGTFCWTPTADDFGIYYFDVLLEDENVCGAEQSIYTFEVKVLCPYCPKEIFYENRQPLPNGVPLPPHTIAGDRITAGESVDPDQVDGIVDTGEDQVIFQAPEIITIEPGFIAGPGFQAIIDPAACTYDCAACCDDFEGFTYDQIPNIFSPDEGALDWSITDVGHPNCAFGAQGFRLTIFNRWGTPVYTFNEEYSTSTCCPFQSPAPENNLERSSIYWDGHNINGTPSNDGEYFYVVTFFSCGHNESIAGSVLLISDVVPQMTSNDDAIGIHEENNFLEIESIDSETIELAQKEIEKFKEPIVYPNPFTDVIFVSLVSEKSVIEIYSLEGKLVTSLQSNSYTESIDVSNLASGTYVLKIVSEGNSHEQLIIKE